MRFFYCGRLQTIKKEKMRRILANLKTTLFGSVTGVTLIADGVGKKDWALILAGVGAFLTGLFAKDHDTH